jgi:murein endopeptidase
VVDQGFLSFVYCQLRLHNRSRRARGLDADVWLTPMPPRELTRAEREEMSATMVVADDRRVT